MKIRLEKSLKNSVLNQTLSLWYWFFQLSLECENPLLSYLHPFFWPLDHLVTKKFCWDEASNTIIQTCLHSNGLTWAGTTVKMVPNLEQGKSKKKKEKSFNMETKQSQQFILKTSPKAVSAKWYSQQRLVEGQGTEDLKKCYPVMQSFSSSSAQLMGHCNREGQDIFRL